MMDDFRSSSESAKSLPSTEIVPVEAKLIPETNDFQTPEQMAAADVGQLNAPVEPQIGPDPESASPKKRFSGLWPPTKKTYLIGGIGLLLIISAISAFFIFHHSPKAVVATIKPKTILKPVVTPAKPIVSNLTGLATTPTTNALPVTAVMVENSTFARPQSGLSSAGVIFEALAEGGITRFMALYQDQQPSNVGPIRSVRPYYEQWALGFDAAIAHDGGSPDALADMKTWDVRNLDEMSNGGSYHRISSRQAPHNLYTGIATLNSLEASKGYTSSVYSSWPRKADAPAKPVTAATINMKLSSSAYNVSYSYDPTTNTYNRSEGGAIQTDANSGAQLSPKVVIAMVVTASQGALDTSDAYYTVYKNIGGGPVDVFQDGAETTGNWSKPTNNAPLSFTTSSGQPIALDAGQTWITVVGSPSDLSYTP